MDDFNIIKQSNNRFYFYRGSLITDEHFAKYLQITVESYRKFLVDNFNAYTVKISQGLMTSSKEGIATYFKTHENCEKAIEWIESYKVMKELTKPAIIVGVDIGYGQSKTGIRQVNW